MSITIYMTHGSMVEGWAAQQFQLANLAPAWIEAANDSEELGRISRIKGLDYHVAPVIVVQNADEISSWHGLTPAKATAAIQLERAAVHSPPVYSVTA